MTTTMRTILSLALLVARVPALPARAATSPEDMCDSPPCSRREIETYEQRASRRGMRMMALRWEALNRGDKRKAAHFDREFNRAEERRAAARRAIESTSD